MPKKYVVDLWTVTLMENGHTRYTPLGRISRMQAMRMIADASKNKYEAKPEYHWFTKRLERLTITFIA